MGIRQGFLTEREERLGRELHEQGYLVRPVEDRGALDELRHQIVELACAFLGVPFPNDVEGFLNHVERIVPVDKLNELRLAVYHRMNGLAWLRPTYFSLARSLIESLVGNELAMQNRVNLSIQLPNDGSSPLDLHADSFGGETPFQVVEWLPLVDCHKTKSMFLVAPAKCRQIYADLPRYQGRGMNAVLDDLAEGDLTWCEVRYGEVLVFSPNYLHGRTVNRESETRWSMDSRFTGLFTPYVGDEKKLGSYYLPITTRPVTRLGLDYQEPSGFSE